MLFRSYTFQKVFNGILSFHDRVVETFELSVFFPVKLFYLEWNRTVAPTLPELVAFPAKSIGIPHIVPGGRVPPLPEVGTIRRWLAVTPNAHGIPFAYLLGKYPVGFFAWGVSIHGLLVAVCFHRVLLASPPAVSATLWHLHALAREELLFSSCDGKWVFAVSTVDLDIL